MKAWVQHSDLHFEYIEIAEEERLDGFPKISRLALGEIKYQPEYKGWWVELMDGRQTGFHTLERSMTAVEFFIMHPIAQA